MFVKLTTAEELKQFVAEHLSEEDRDFDVHWFVATYEARSLLDSCTTKDIASMLMGGCRKIDDEYVVNFLETLYSDLEGLTDQEVEEYIAESGDPNQPIINHIEYMFNE